MKKRLVALIGVVLMIATVVSGCVKMDPEQTLATVGGVDIKLDLANFYARYQQSQIEEMFGSYMGGADMWKQDIEGQNYEELTQESILDTLILMHILEARQDEFGVSLSEKETDEIAEVAQAFLEANGEEEKAVISATRETVERMLTLTAIEAKMRTAMTADVDTNVSDKEAAQKKIEYVAFLFTSTDEEGVTKVVEEDGKEALREEAQKFAEEAKEAKNFAGLARERSYTAQEATFDSESTHIDVTLLAEVDELKEGDITGVVETGDGYYVAKLISLLDREATDERKETIIVERKNEAYQELSEQWREEASIERDDTAWKAISFIRQGVVRPVEEEPEAVDVGEGTNTEMEAAESESE
jgi:Parvulin-like peptidyl-prolyl isomerase